jgi:peptidoglycan/xylan/chitin deacetylase (PgdA/CDA1 family)
MPHSSQRSVVFLMYHELDTPERSASQTEPGYLRYVLGAADFESQMRRLKFIGRQASNVTDALTFSAPCVAITFDDGCESDLLIAAPILFELGFAATFYITSGFLGRTGYLSVSQLRQLSDLGFEIGCHSMSHPYLTELDQAAMDREMIDSKRRLEQITGKAIDHFSCPGGRFNQLVVETARRAGYRTIANSRAHANSVNTDFFALGRVAVMRGMTLDTFDSLCRGRGLWRKALADSCRHTVRTIVGNSSYDRLRAGVLGRG